MTDGAGGCSRRPSPVAPDGPARSAATPSPPFTMDLRMCDDEGMVVGKYLDVLNRLRSLGHKEPYDGEPFPCTGSAHLAGGHIRCVSTAHLRPPTDALPERPERDENPLPEDLERLLRDPNIAIPQDVSVHEVIIADLRRRPEESTVPRNAYLNLWALYEKAVRDA